MRQQCLAHSRCACHCCSVQLDRPFRLRLKGRLHALPPTYPLHARVLALQVRVEASCLTEHPEKSGPTACTTCGVGPNGMKIHHTIIDPRTNTGTCTMKECPFCKPKACCGAKHKHYVVNSE